MKRILALAILGILMSVPAMAARITTIPGAWVTVICSGMRFDKVRVVETEAVPRVIIYDPIVNIQVGKCIGPYVVMPFPDTAQ
jgi:hypothetical protein